MGKPADKEQNLFGDQSEIDEKVLNIHNKHIRNHPYLEEYDSAGDYFERELSISTVADGYYEMPVHSALRLHSYGQRDFLLLQKNPNLPTSWVESNVHWSYEDLTGELPQSVRMNALQTAKTISGYLNDTDTVRIGLKSIIDAVQSELDCEFGGNALRQSDYERYVQFSESRSYRDNREGGGADLSVGFHNDFAYTNRCKFQARGSSADPSTADDEWLADELSAIGPKVVFALGGAAYDGLRNIGFEKVGERSQYSTGKTGRILRYAGDQPNLNETYAVHLYHLDYRQTLTTDRDVHDALGILAHLSDSL